MKGKWLCYLSVSMAPVLPLPPTKTRAAEKLQISGDAAGITTGDAAVDVGTTDTAVGYGGGDGDDGGGKSVVFVDSG